MCLVSRRPIALTFVPFRKFQCSVISLIAPAIHQGVVFKPVRSAGLRAKEEIARVWHNLRTKQFLQEGNASEIPQNCILVCCRSGRRVVCVLFESAAIGRTVEDTTTCTLTSGVARRPFLTLLLRRKVQLLYARPNS